jgi:predicted short-subunit dehydrogenase-like oxidoreductase (DUF2520 family)
MKIAFIGSGNMATFLATNFYLSGHEIIQIVSKNLDHAKELAEKVQAHTADSLHELTQSADVYFLAMNDNSIQDFGKHQTLTEKIVIHTAGSISLQELNEVSANLGCIWCLYSIQKDNLPKEKDIPVFINSSNETTKNIVYELASSISSSIHEMNDEQKLKLHLAAVWVNNYTNHLATIAESLLKEEGIPFHHLLPILEQTIVKIKTSSPSQNQTGPAVRKDTAILAKHAGLLNHHELWKRIYELMAESIQRA